MQEIKDAVKEAIKELMDERDTYPIQNALSLQSPREYKSFDELPLHERMYTMSNYLGQLTELNKSGVEVHREINAVTGALNKVFGI